MFGFLLSAIGWTQSPPHRPVLGSPVQAHSDWDFEVIPLAANPPSGIYVLRRNGMACRIPQHRLPFLISSADPRYSAYVREAVAVWTRGSLNLGLGYLLQASDDPSSADVVIRWSDPRLPRDKAGATWWMPGLNQGFQRVLGISMDGAFQIPDGNRVQILSHELGHVLGLDESPHNGDLMYYLMDRRRLAPGQVALSQRDLQGLHWLYQQQRYTAIRGRRD